MILTPSSHRVELKIEYKIGENLEALWHGQRCLHLFVDSEAYQEQMGPIPSSNGSLDIALSNAHA